MNSKEYISFFKSLRVVVVEKPRKTKNIISFAKKYLPPNVYIPAQLAKDVIQLKDKIGPKNVKAIFKAFVRGLSKIDY